MVLVETANLVKLGKLAVRLQYLAEGLEDSYTEVQEGNHTGVLLVVLDVLEIGFHKDLSMLKVRFSSGMEHLSYC